MKALLERVVLDMGTAVKTLAQEDLAKDWHSSGRMNTAYPDVQALGLAITTSAAIQVESHQFGAIEWIQSADGDCDSIESCFMRRSLG